MKHKIFFLIVALVLASSLFATALSRAPASAGTLSWTEEPAATDLKAKVDNVLAPTDLDIVDLAVKGDTIYAATNNSSNPLFKSTDGGKSWSNLYSSTSFPTGAALKAVAIAPDNADIVAIITATDNVAYSTNGGSSWTVLGRPADGALAVDIDVAPGGSYIAVGGNTSTGNAELWTFYLALAQTWTARASGNFTTGQLIINAVKFSPSFTTDKIITVVSSNATNASFQLFRYESGAYTWNGDIAFLTYADWLQGLTIATVTGGVAKADIALPSTYNGTDNNTRIAFVGLAGATSGGGVYRLTDAYKENFTTWNAGDEGPIHSLAYHDSGKLLAGDFDGSQVYVALTPMAASPKFERINTFKQPGGERRVIVAWSGDNAVAATSGDESAFAVSTDDGYAFNDTSLIDTTLATVVDIAVSADGSQYYLTSYDGNDASVWLRDTAWTRVFSLKNQTNVSFLVRLAPDDASAVYVAVKNSQDMWVSKDSGMKDWMSIPVYSLGTGNSTLDFVVQSADTVYAIDDDGVTKTINAGASWDTQKKPVDAFVPYMITLAPNGDVLVGGSDGYVAFSTDGGDTFTRTQPVATTGVLNVQVAADDDYVTNNILYAGAGVEVKRGEADSTTAWTSRKPSSTNGPGAIDATQSVTGLLVDNITGVVYVLTANTTASALFHSLNLETATSSTPDVWSSETSTSSYVAAPQTLKMSFGKLWAIGTPNLVHSFWVYISSFLMGDANGDGKVNALDITKVERIIAGLD